MGGTNSFGAAVSGQLVAGYSYLAPGDTSFHAFADNTATSPTMVDLGSLGGDSQATAASGTIVVGDSFLAGDTNEHAFAYDMTATPPTMIDLGTLRGSSDSDGDNYLATGVSGNIVVGSSITSTGATDAFYYDLGTGTIHDLGTLGGDFSAAQAVDGNTVVGYSFTSGDAAMHAFAYVLPTGPMQDLGSLGGSTSAALAVSGSLVVGYSTVTGDSGFHAFSYDLTTTGPMQDLGTNGGTDSQALAVDGTSDVVAGWGDPSSNVGTDPTVWSVTSTTSTALASSINPASVSQALTYTAKVSPTPAGGTMAFSQNGAPIAGCSAIAVSTGVAKCPTTAGTSGAHTVVAKYSGAGRFLRSTSPTLTETTKARTTSTALTSSVNPASTSQALTYTAKVSPTPGGGTVAFSQNGTPIARCSAVAVSAGVAKCPTTAGTSGTHKVVAKYSGDGVVPGQHLADLDRNDQSGSDLIFAAPSLQGADLAEAGPGGVDRLQARADLPRRRVATTSEMPQPGRRGRDIGNHRRTLAVCRRNVPLATPGLNLPSRPRLRGVEGGRH